jgi:hypothetical protein
MGLFSKIRTSLYTVAKVLGDVDAVKEGRVAKRVKNRILGKVAGKILNKL